MNIKLPSPENGLTRLFWPAEKLLWHLITPSVSLDWTEVLLGKSDLYGIKREELFPAVLALADVGYVKYKDIGTESVFVQIRPRALKDVIAHFQEVLSDLGAVRVTHVQLEIGKAVLV